MSKWMCKCGRLMNDHDCPDKNAYRAYSDEEWERIADMTDEDNKISWYDIPLQTFDVYVCPACGRLMVFGDSDRFTSYEPEPD